MLCTTHPEADAASRCTGCAEPFCPTCLVEVAGQRYCGACKTMAVKGRPVVDRHMSLCIEAKTALVCSLIGILWWGFILGSIAIFQGFKARRRVREDPSLTGSGLAAAGIVVGALVLVLNILNILALAS